MESQYTDSDGNVITKHSIGGNEPLYVYVKGRNVYVGHERPTLSEIEADADAADDAEEAAALRDSLSL